MEPLCTYWNHLAVVIWLSPQKPGFSQREPHFSMIFSTCCSFNLPVVFAPVLFTDRHLHYVEPQRLATQFLNCPSIDRQL